MTDGVQQARAIPFFTVAGGRVTRITEYWPEAYEAPAGREHLTELIQSIK